MSSSTSRVPQHPTDFDPGPVPSSDSPVATTNPDRPTSDATTSADPGSPTSSPPGGGPTTPTWPAIPPTVTPSFVLGEDGSTYYTNTTIDDFSPLVTFSEDGNWLTVRTDPASSAVRPAPQRNWFLGTYKRTEIRNATVTIQFYGSELYLYGDKGPNFGVYLLELDEDTPILQTAYEQASGTDRAQLLYTFRDLTEGRHDLVITNLGTREGLNDGPSLLFDFAIARQKVGVPGRLRPQVFEIKGDELQALAKNGTWSLNTVQDDVPPGQGGAKPEIYVERKAFWTTENLATLTVPFRGTGIQVYGGRNATHGSYRATLLTIPSNTIVRSETYSATADCDFAVPDNIRPACDWRGSSLKYSAADLNPDERYELVLENLGGGDAARGVFEVDLVRTVDLRDANDPVEGGDGAGNGNGNGNGSGGGPGNSAGSSGSGAHKMVAPVDPLLNFILLLVSFLAVWKTLKN
ncbi:hypothetical protein FA15DRAFT_429398 [Coprinopsis marcescibilis]|uniref:Uncharacterized protein n=1 Tax=Coprinopsis marcescibilis TaxID=230819 RepID=A0A5C3L822_COPMA|nr:hypothetical protein FA15DRAFT_429398 [Coprinopsis marcescibilis]